MASDIISSQSDRAEVARKVSAHKHFLEQFWLVDASSRRCYFLANETRYRYRPLLTAVLQDLA